MENSLDIDEDRTQVSAECGGYCGGCRAHGGNLAVELDYCPQEGIKSKTIFLLHLHTAGELM